ncbi:Uncharacterised protein [uncultured archaeon]|nr:Uncharacterised protein [uncultured archaeon]
MVNELRKHIQKIINKKKLRTIGLTEWSTIGRPKRYNHMNNSNIELEITEGKAQWILDLKKDSLNLKFFLTHNPEISTPEKLLIFEGVTKFKSNWIDQNKNSIEGLIGAKETYKSRDTEYLIVTDQREIIFKAKSRKIEIITIGRR